MLAIYLIGYLITVVGISMLANDVEANDTILLSIIWPYVWFLIIFVYLPAVLAKTLGFTKK